MRCALFLVLAVPIFADAISVGAVVGVPLTDIVQTAGEIGARPFQANVKRFAIGPVIDVRLPLGLGVEFGAIYKRFDQHAGQYQVIAEPGMLYQIQNTAYSKTGQSWEFPIIGQYRFPVAVIRPYLEAGLSFNHLTGVFAPFRTLVSQSAILKPDGLSEDRRGIVFGGGLESKRPFVRIKPGVRWTRYGNTRWFWLPSANVVDFLVGLTF